MEKSLFARMGGTYTQVGDYLLPNLTLPKGEQRSIGIWGQRHLHHIKQHRRALYTELLTVASETITLQTSIMKLNQCFLNW